MSNPTDSHGRSSGRVDVPVFGILITAVGIVLLLNTFNVVEWSVWGQLWRLWPVLLVLVGLKILFGPFSRPIAVIVAIAVIGTVIGFAFIVSRSDLYSADFSDFTYDIDADTSTALELEVDFGAGKLIVLPTDVSDDRMLAVEFFDDESGVDISTSVRDTTRRVELSVGSTSFPFISGAGDDREWTVFINRTIPVTLQITGGAGHFIIDLEDTSLTEFEIDLGAADLDLTVPASAGHVTGSIDAGAADIHVSVPENVAARIDNDSGVSSVNIDSERFPRRGDLHESTDFGTAPNRLDLSINAGASTIKVD